MTTQGLLAAGMAVLSLFMSIFQSPEFLIGGTFSTLLAWQLLTKPAQKNFKKKALHLLILLTRANRNNSV